MNNKALIVGLGSMGKRRAGLLRELGVPTVGVDSNPERAEGAKGLVGGVYASIKEALLKESPTVAFVCTSPLSHGAIAKELLTAGVSVFTELNLINENYEELRALANERGVTVFPSSTWLYRREMQYMTERLHEKKDGKFAYTYHIGQYLPDWHPWESYKNYFIGDKRTNGCREILALELPWLVRAFGKIVDVHAVARRLTDLEIEYPDTFLVQITHENGSVGALLVDITSPVPIRSFEAIGDHLHLFWGGKPDALFAFNPETKEKEAIALYESVTRKDGYASFIIENAYMDEVRAFLDEVRGEREAIYSLEEDAEILSWIDKIEGFAK